MASPGTKTDSLALNGCSRPSSIQFGLVFSILGFWVICFLYSNPSLIGLACGPLFLVAQLSPNYVNLVVTPPFSVSLHLENSAHFPPDSTLNERVRVMPSRVVTGFE